jgi:hypothetical protein
VDSARSIEAPLTIHETVSSPGRPLDPAARAYMEPRFGRDFGDVRIHTDARADASARSVDALAYTVGRNLVFGSGQYAPHSTSGRRLLAHELAHVVQQDRTGARVLQRQPAAPAPAPAASKCPPFPAPGFDAVVSDELFFGVPLAELFRAGDGTLTVDPGEQFLLSYHSISGKDPSKSPPPVFFGGLRWESGGGTLDADPTEGVGRWTAPSTPGDVTLTIRTVAQNCLMARVKVHVAAPPAPKPPPAPPPPAPPAKLPERVCGPDISEKLAEVLAEVRTTFASWSGGDQGRACVEILNLPMALSAWDIVDLFVPETEWLRLLPFFPTCGTPGPGPNDDFEDAKLCSNSVEVDGKCFLAGTVNYALFGQMCRLCSDAHLFFSTLQLITESPLAILPTPIPIHWRSDRETMLDMITIYKLGGTWDDDGPPRAWAAAGFDGYPGHVPSTANRSTCATVCPVPFERSLKWVWEPIHGR